MPCPHCTWKSLNVPGRAGKLKRNAIPEREDHLFSPLAPPSHTTIPLSKIFRSQLSNCQGVRLRPDFNSVGYSRSYQTCYILRRLVITFPLISKKKKWVSQRRRGSLRRLVHSSHPSKGSLLSALIDKKDEIVNAFSNTFPGQANYWQERC